MKDESLAEQLQNLIANKQREACNIGDDVRELQAQINLLIDRRKTLLEEISSLSRAKNIVSQ